VGLNKRGEEVDRFEGNKPENGFVNFYSLRKLLSFKPNNNLKNSLLLLNPGSEPLSNLPIVFIYLSSAPAIQNQEPSKNLKLEFVNGWTVEDSRQNLFWGAKTD
jgi:hypothetical protein